MNDDKENNSNLYNVNNENNENKDDNKNDEESSFEPCYIEGNLGYPNKILNKDSNMQLDSNIGNNYIDQSYSNEENPSDFEGNLKDRNSKKSKEVNNNLQTDITNNQIINTNNNNENLEYQNEIYIKNTSFPSEENNDEDRNNKKFDENP